MYRSRKEAERIRNRREHHVSKLRVYQCNVCYGWHLTSHKADQIYGAYKKKRV